MNKIETILHPVRFRIIQRFLDGQSKTTKMLAKELKDIPQATLYRQLDALVKAEVLIITEENPIRGTVEKLYSLNSLAASITNQDVKETYEGRASSIFSVFYSKSSQRF